MSFQQFIQDFSGKNILIFGLGLLGGGRGVVEVFQQFDCHIRITDKKSATELHSITSTLSKKNIDQMIFGDHQKEDIEWADIIIKNPAVPVSSEYIQYALELGKHVTTEVALFLKYTESTTVGITGTRGKTTTTMATHYILQKQLKAPVVLGGNLRDNASLPLLISETPATISVLELSSFALEGCHTEQVSPDISAITNLYSDHLDRYADQQAYAEAKSAILAYQKPSDTTFLNESDEWTPFFEKFTHAQITYVRSLTEFETLSPRLQGKHNHMNLSFAVEIAVELGVDRDSAITTSTTFEGAPFRQQVVGGNGKTTFINDSTSTTPEAVIVALEAFPNAHFIIGGTTKHLDMSKLAQKLESYTGRVFFLKGSGTTELLSKLSGDRPVYNSLSEAFTAAVSGSPEYLVFSPGFTSFELFKNEFDRAEQFNELVSKHVKNN